MRRYLEGWDKQSLSFRSTNELPVISVICELFTNFASFPIFLSLPYFTSGEKDTKLIKREGTRHWQNKMFRTLNNDWKILFLPILNIVKLARAQIKDTCPNWWDWTTKMLKLFLRTLSSYKSRWPLSFINVEHTEHLCVHFVLGIEGLSNVTLTPWFQQKSDFITPLPQVTSAHKNYFFY